MTAHWYIVHTYSNFEKKAAEEIKRQALLQGLNDLIEEVMVPTEEVVEVRRGHKVNAERKFLPGYILVKADLTNEAYHLIKNVPKVTGFLGPEQQADAAAPGRGGPDSQSGAGRGGASQALHHLRDRRTGARGRWAVHLVQRHRRRKWTRTARA